MSSISKTSKGKSKAVTLDIDTFNTFWFGAEHRTGDERAQTAADKYRVETFNSFVPKLVLRRYCISPSPMNPPELERYDACVLFTDISGFTKLTETLAKNGLEGVEKLTGYLNSYFGKLIELIRTHGGDIVKFAGDALLALFPCVGTNNPSTNPNLPAMAQLACQCALVMQENFGNYVVEDCTLRLHIGIAAGRTYGIHVGKLDGRIEFFIAGETLEQVAACETLAKPGEIFVSAQLLQLIGDNLIVRQKHKEPAAKLLGVRNNLACPMTKNFPLLLKMEAEDRPYVPPAVLSYFTSNHRLSTSSSAAPVKAPVTELLAELRTVTVLFLDLGIPKENTFSKATDEAGEQIALGIVQNAFVRIQTVLTQFEGTIRQFLMDDKGTVLIAAFGVPPLSHADDAQRAVGAALEITTQLSAYDIKCSVGITTGMAFCGTVGNNSRREYAIVGDIVNLSARLMGASKGKIYCDEATYKLTATRYSFLALAPIRVKGKSNEIPIFFPQCERTIDINVDETLIGRDAEIAWIKDALEVVKKTNTSRTLIIEGVAGMGKTRLLEELPQLMALDDRVFVGVADDINISTPFYAWRNIISTIFDLHRLETKAEKQARFRDFLTNHDPELISILPLLNEVLPDLEFRENETTRDMPVQVRPENLNTLLISLLKLPPGSVIVLENAQWLDSTSWSLALSASQTLSAVALLIVMRPMKPQPFELAQMLHLPSVLRLKLQGLAQKDVMTLVSRVIGVEKLDESVEKELKKLLENAAGNPFMVKGIATVYRDGGAAAADNGIQGLITSKLDRLPPQLQILLKVASVVGSVCPVDLVRSLLQTILPNRLTNEELQQQLVELDRLGFICCDFVGPAAISGNPNAPGMGSTSAFPSSLVRSSSSSSLGLALSGAQQKKEFRFQDRQTRDVIYELMLFSQRRSFHSKVAEWYEKTYPNFSSQLAATIGYHWKNAEDAHRPKAVKYFMKLGDRSCMSFAMKEAIKFFNQAIEITGPIKQPTYDDVKLQRKVGQACLTVGDYERADAALRTAAKYLQLQIPSRESREKLSKEKLKVTIKHKKVISNLVQFFPPDDQPHIEREVILILLYLSKTNYFLACKPLAIFFNDWAVEVVTMHESRVLLAEVYSNAIVISGLRNDSLQADKYILQTISLCHDQLQPLVYCNLMSGIYFASSGGWSKARRYFLEAMDIGGNNIGDRSTFEKCLIYIAMTYYLEGDLLKSLDHAEKALASAKRRADTLSTVEALMTTAMVLESLGKITDSEDRFNEAREGFESIGYRDPAWEVTLNSLQALLAYQQQDYEKAINFADAVSKQLSKTEPIHFFAFLGYYTPVEVLLGVAGSGVSFIGGGAGGSASGFGGLTGSGGGINNSPSIMLSSPSNQNKQTLRNRMANIEKALTLLKNFADNFPFAIARYHLWKGTLFQLQHKKEKALSCFRDGLLEANKFGLRFEEGLLRSHLLPTISSSDSCVTPDQGGSGGTTNSGDFSSYASSPEGGEMDFRQAISFLLPGSSSPAPGRLGGGGGGGGSG